MGSKPSTPKATPTPPEPATVKYTEQEVSQARRDAKSSAAKKYGIGATNVTRGALADEDANVKKKTLGGE
jgi:hypothetical protein